MLFSWHSFSPKEQASFNFMAAVTICSDFGAQKKKVSLLTLFPYLFVMKRWDRELPTKLKTAENLESILKSRDIILPTKVCLVKAMFFPVVMHGLRVGV